MILHPENFFPGRHCETPQALKQSRMPQNKRLSRLLRQDFVLPRDDTNYLNSKNFINLLGYKLDD